MSQTTMIFDSDGNFAPEVFQQQARKIRNAQNVALKSQELDRLGKYFSYLAQMNDPNDPAMVELWRSGLFEEVIEILSTPMSQDLRGHVGLYHIALLILNDILLSPWMHNSQAKSFLKSSAPAILREQNFAYGLPMGEVFKFKFRDSLLGVFGELLPQFQLTGDNLEKALDSEVLMGLVFDYYFGITPPTVSRGNYSAMGASRIVFAYAGESFGGEPAPYMSEVLAQFGEKHVADRYIELVKKSVETRVLLSQCSWSILAFLISAQPLRKRLLKDAKVHVSTMTSTWKEASSLYEDQNLVNEIVRGILFHITHMIREIDDALRPSFVQDLVQTDLILLLGRALFASRDIVDWIGEIDGLMKSLVADCQLQSHAKSDLAQIQWIHVWRSLNSSRRATTGSFQAPSREAAMTFWLEFGREVLDITLESYWTGSRDTPHVQACEWIKCPRFGDVWQSEWDTTLLPSHCTGCYMANYCSTTCQKLDWTEGDHKKICKHLVAASGNP